MAIKDKLNEVLGKLRKAQAADLEKVKRMQAVAEKARQAGATRPT